MASDPLLCYLDQPTKPAPPVFFKEEASLEANATGFWRCELLRLFPERKGDDV
jgi:hypothetical protein